MKAIFHAKRESIHKVHIERYTSLNGIFHFHSHIELLWVKQGEADAWINDTVETVRENEIAVILGYEAHQFRSREGKGDFVSLFIPSSYCPDFSDAVQSKRAYHPVLRDARATEGIRRAVNMLAEDLNPIEQKGYVHVILGTVLKHLALEKNTEPKETDLPVKLLFYINEHYKESISIDSIASALGYSRHHLSKCFHAHFHIGIASYVNTLRLRNAVMLMQKRDKSITECALESGFGSVRTFYRVFDEEFGCAPRDYLQQSGSAPLSR